MQIVLKDRNDQDVTFTYRAREGTTAIFDSAEGPLLGRKRLTLKLTGNTNVNRVKVVLSVPRRCADEGDCGVPTIKYTQVASADFSVVTFSTEEDRQDLAAMFSSLVASPDVEDLVVDGIIPGV